MEVGDALSEWGCRQVLSGWVLRVWPYGPVLHMHAGRVGSETQHACMEIACLVSYLGVPSPLTM